LAVRAVSEQTTTRVSKVLAGISPRRFTPATTVIDLDAPVPANLVRLCFDTRVLNRVWTSDIT
jgi:hypothetical protein